MSLLDGLKTAVIEILRPGTRQQLGEGAVLKQMYEASNAQAILPNSWYRLHNEAGACVGFSYVCNCKTEHQLFSAFEWMRPYACPACAAKFDLLKHVGIKNVDGDFTKKPEEWEALLAKLPVRPRLAGKQQQSFVDTWSNDNGDVVWDGAPPSAVGWK
jgi:hypothetical protein